jgi:hypothetical protein
MFWVGIVTGLIGLLAFGADPIIGGLLLLSGIALTYWGNVRSTRGRVAAEAASRPIPRAAAEPGRAVEPVPSLIQRVPPPAREGGVIKAALAWTAEQEANLLLYLGAFLIVVATLVLVGSSQRTIGPAGNMALLVAGTVFFLVAGFFCLRNARVRQAGTVFVAVSALMFPLNFVGAYVFFLQDKEIDPSALWLGGSLASALFYGAVSFLGVGRWYPVPAATALASALLAGGVLVDAPVESGPAAFILLGLLLVLPAQIRLGRVTEVLGQTWYWMGYIAAVGALGVVLALSGRAEEANLEVQLDWLWLGASSTSLAFFAVVSWRRTSEGQPWATVVSLLTLLASSLALVDTPPEVYPVAYSLLALILTVPSITPTGRIGTTFGLPSLVAAYMTITAAALAALILREEGDGEWYLLATLAFAAGLFWLQALVASSELLDAMGFRQAVAGFFSTGGTSARLPDLRPVQSLVALLLSGCLPLSAVYALDPGNEWYGPAAMVTAWAYAAGTSPFLLRWPGRYFLGWLAIGAASLSLYLTAVLAGATFVAVDGFIAAALYLVMARVHQSTENTFPALPTRYATAGLVHAAGVALSVGYFNLLDATQFVNTSDAVDVAYAFFGLSLALTLVAMTGRWWWREARPSLYSVALIMGLLVFWASARYVDKAWLVLCSYAAASLAVTIWEGDRRGLAVSATFGFFAVLETWRYFEPRDAYAPLLLTVMGAALLIAPSLRSRLVPLGRFTNWADDVRRIGLAYLLLAPVAAWAGLAFLAGRDVDTSAATDSKLLIQVGAVGGAFLLVVSLKSAFQMTDIGAVVSAALLMAGGAAYAQILLLDDYAALPDCAAALNLSAVALFAIIARQFDLNPVVVLADSRGPRQPTRDAIVVGALLYVAGLAFNFAFYYGLNAMAGIGLDDSQAVSWAFAGLVAFEASVGVVAGWSWPTLRLPAYGAAVTTTLVSLAFALDFEGQLFLLLLFFAVAAVVLSVLEREPRALAVGATYAFIAVFAGRAYFDAGYAVVPIALSILACSTFALAALIKKATEWRKPLFATGSAYGVLAPMSGAWLLVRLANPEGFLDSVYFLESDLYQATVLSIALLALLAFAMALVVRSRLLAVLASAILTSALLLEIAHFQPDNLQAYPVPLGLYLFVLVLLTSRYGDLPEELSPWFERLYGLGPTIIMAPSFFQSLEKDAWGYGLVLLGESLAFLAVAVIQRRPWLLTIAVSFVIANGLHYLFFERTLPTWATLSLAGVLLMLAGTAILSARDRWPAIQEGILAWWERTPRAKAGHA